jgi:hypothetical protein
MACGVRACGTLGGMRSSWRWISGCLMVLGCGELGGGRVQSAEVVPVVQGPVTPAASEPAAASAAAASEPAAAASAVADDGADVAAPSAGGWSVVAIRDGELRIAELGGEVMIAGGGVLMRAGADGAMERVPNATYGLLDPGGMYLSRWEVGAIGGRWPDPVWLHTRSQGQRSMSAPMMYYRKGERWQRKATRTGGVMHWYYHAFAPWTGEQVLALRLMISDAALDQSTGEPPAPALQRKIDAALAAEPPRFDVLAAGTAPVPAPMRLAPGARFITFTAVATGEVFVLLAQREGVGDEETTTYAVQRFAPGATEGTIDRLTELGDALRLDHGVLAARSADAVYLAGDHGDAGVFARFDGRRWTRVPGPPGGAVTAVTVGGDGAVWAIAYTSGYAEGASGTAVWKRVGDGAWTEVALPRVREPAAPRWIFREDESGWKEVVPDGKAETVQPGELVVRGTDDVWISGRVVGGEEGMMIRHAVLRSRPVARTLVIDDDATLRMELIKDLPPEPWRPGDMCSGGSSPWLRIATLAADATADAGTALADALVAAIPAELQRSFEVLREAEVGGQRVVGLYATPGDAAEVKKLLAALDKLHPGERRRFECRDPRPLRELRDFF